MSDTQPEAEAGAARKAKRQSMSRDISTVGRHIGDRIRMRRKYLRLSQTSLGHLVGISFQQVQKYEHGSSRISASLLYQLASSLGVPVSYFFEKMPALSLIPSPDEATPPGSAEHTLAELPLPLQKQIMDLVLSISRNPRL